MLPGFFVTSDGASSGADNRGRRNRRKAHIRNRPAGSNSVRSRNNHSRDRNIRTRPPRRRRVRRQQGRKQGPGRCPVPAPQPAPSRRWRQLWQPSPKLPMFSSCASPDIEYTRDNAEVFRWFQREPGSATEIVRTIFFFPLHLRFSAVAAESRAVSFYSPKYSRMILLSSSFQCGLLSNSRSSVSNRSRTDGSSARTTDCRVANAAWTARRIVQLSGHERSYRQPDFGRPRAESFGIEVVKIYHHR